MYQVSEAMAASARDNFIKEFKANTSDDVPPEQRWDFRNNVVEAHLSPEFWVKYMNAIGQALNKEISVRVPKILENMGADDYFVEAIANSYNDALCIYQMGYSRLAERALAAYADVVHGKPKKVRRIRGEKSTTPLSIESSEPVQESEPEPLQEQEPEPEPEPVQEQEPEQESGFIPFGMLEFPKDYVVPYWLEYVDRKLRRQEFLNLYGGAGCGKTHGVFTLAKVRGWVLHVMTAPQRVSDIVGGRTATGYLESDFIKAFRADDGQFHLILIDEADKMPRDCQMLFATAFSEKVLSHPATGELIPMGNCAVVCCMNTNGTGPTTHYPTAVAWDTALCDRFLFKRIDPSHELNLAICKDEELAEFVTAVQEASNASGLYRANVSLRGAVKIKEGLEDGDSLDDIIDGVIRKGASKKTMMSLLGKMNQDVLKYNWLGRTLNAHVMELRE